jgi:hypothetical protein
MTKQFKLKGVNALDEVVKLGKDVLRFTDEKNYFSVEKASPGNLKVTTPKGVYHLKRNTQQNIYQGTLGGHKVQVSLQKVSGWIGYW